MKQGKLFRSEAMVKKKKNGKKKRNNWKLCYYLKGNLHHFFQTKTMPKKQQSLYKLLFEKAYELVHIQNKHALKV